MTLADENKKVCDEMLEGLPDSIAVHYDSLNTRVLVSQNEDELLKALDRLTCSFSFEAQELITDNSYAYEIELPRIIID